LTWSISSSASKKRSSAMPKSMPRSRLDLNQMPKPAIR
jgi:hypothetical protein